MPPLLLDGGRLLAEVTATEIAPGMGMAGIGIGMPDTWASAMLTTVLPD